MSLSNTNYLNISKLKNVEENWLFQLFNQNSYLSFDGDESSGDFVDMGASTSSSPVAITSATGITIAFWINFPTLGATEPIFRSHDHADDYIGYGVDKNSSNNISLSWYDGSGATANDRKTMTGDTTLSANTDYFVVITSTFAQATSGTKIYINGTTSDSITASGNSSITTPNYGGSSLKTLIGQKLPSTDLWGEFKLRNFAVWNTRLDQTNTNPIAAAYNGGSYLDLSKDFGNYTQSSSLKLYLEFNKGNNTAVDLSQNNDAGTIYNAVYGGFLGLAFGSTKVSRAYYHGVVKSSPSIRESIDLMSSTAKSSNLTIQAINSKYEGFNLSEELFGGSKYYYNQTVKVYSQLNKNENINNCMQIYHGRLSNISHTIEDINISVVQQRPWDFIVVPNTKTTERKVLIPVSYGNYTKNAASTFSSPKFRATLTSYDYKEVPFNRLSGGFATYPVASSSSSDSELAIYNDQFDMLIPLANGNAATISEDGSNQAKVESRIQRIYGVRPDSTTTITVGDEITVSNLNNLFDADSSSYAQFSADFNSFKAESAAYYLNIDTPEEDVNFFQLRSSGGDRVVINDSGGINATDTTLIISDASSLFVGSIIKLNAEIATVTNVSSNTLTIVRGEYSTNATSHDNGLEVFTTNNYNVLHIKWNATVTAADTSNSPSQSFLWFIAGTEGAYFEQKYITSNVSTGTTKIPFPGFCKQIVLAPTFIGNGSDTITGNFKIYDVYIVASRESKTPPKSLFVASDGLTSSISDTTTMSGAITSGLYAHRDMLARFTGYDVADSELYNWSNNINVNSLRSSWSIRINLIKEYDLKRILEQIQKEFGFIFKFRADGSGSYWTVKASYASGDVVETLTKSDISSIKISHTSFNELLTKINVNYKKHPSESRYLATTISEDTTTSPTPRQRMNIRDKENVSTVNLDYNVDKPGNTDIGAGSSDPADGYSDYYMNIFGDIKKIISCDVVNISKGYRLEAGDIVKFNIDEIKPYGSNWSNYYMITSIQRGLKKINITCREVG